MKKQAIIEKTIKAINQLPEDKAIAIAHFVDFMCQRYEEYLLTEEIKQIVSNNQTFVFLNQDEDLYSESDLKEVYHC